MSSIINEEMAKILACPSCKSSLIKTEQGLSCGKCKKSYFYKKGVPIFIKEVVADEESAEESLRTKFKKSPRLLSLIRTLKRAFGPPETIYRGNEKEIVEELFKKSNLALNIGSSSMKSYPNSINLDIGLFDNVDVVAEGKSLPFKNDSFSLVLIESVLEHVDEPEKIIEESYRVLKKSGRVYISIPFVYVFHGSPNDFGRYTINGLKRRLELAGFKIEDSGIISGPSSTLNQMLRYYASILLSFNNDFLFSMWLNIFGWITFPIKYLDKFLNSHKKALLMPSIIYAVGKK